MSVIPAIRKARFGCDKIIATIKMSGGIGNTELSKKDKIANAHNAFGCAAKERVQA